MEIICKVMSINSTSIGAMFKPVDNFTFEDLIRWVYRNCPGDRKIIIDKDTVEAHYDDRVEIYYFKKEM